VKLFENYASRIRLTPPAPIAVEMSMKPLPDCYRQPSSIGRKDLSLSQSRRAMLKNEVGGQRGTVSCSDFPGLPESIWGTVLFQPPLPKPDRHLSAHPAFQRGSSTGIGLLRHPPHPLGSVCLLLRPFPLSWALPLAFGYYCRSVTMRLAPRR
jgi:hypothetical protein